jgi:hypothetical protein
VRDKILETFDTLQPDDCRSTSMGATGEDVLLSPAARALVPFQIECKNKAKFQGHTFYEQALEHGEHEPLVIVKRDYGIPLAMLSAETFFRMLKQLHASNSRNED